MITTLNKCKVCITGKLDKMVRRIAFDKIRAVGGFPQTKITTDTDFLVVADGWEKEEPSYKLQKADEWWIPCITEEDFYYLIGEEDESRRAFA